MPGEAAENSTRTSLLVVVPDMTAGWMYVFDLSTKKSIICKKPSLLPRASAT
jgi:hypothetical protein